MANELVKAWHAAQNQAEHYQQYHRQVHNMIMDMTNDGCVIGDQVNQLGVIRSSYQRLTQEAVTLIQMMGQHHFASNVTVEVNQMRSKVQKMEIDCNAKSIEGFSATIIECSKKLKALQDVRPIDQEATTAKQLQMVALQSSIILITTRANAMAALSYDTEFIKATDQALAGYSTQFTPLPVLL